MKKSIHILLVVCLVRSVYAAGRTETALTLLEPAGARAAALGEAYASMSDDITALGYNPASLRTLKTGQASFLLQRGLSEDSMARFMIGTPHEKLAYGLSFAYYTSGTVETYDGHVKRSVIGQKDLTVGLGLAQDAGPLALGLQGKFYSSEIAEQAQASAFTVDAGLHVPVNDRFQLGISLQNLGGDVTYVSESEPLPRLGRVGFGWLLSDEGAPLTLMADGIYRFQTAEFNPAFGLESFVGPLALRAGYQSGSQLEEFTVGTGFSWAASSLDYTFGLSSEFNSTHRISYGMRFGDGSPDRKILLSRNPS